MLRFILPLHVLSFNVRVSHSSYPPEGVHGSMFLGCSPTFYPVEQPPRSHTQGPRFCALRPLLAYRGFLFFVLILVTGPRVLISAPCSSH